MSSTGSDAGILSRHVRRKVAGLSPGHAFAAGDLIVELETHKALVEVRAGQPGVLRRIVSPAGDWQAIGQPLALLSDDPTEALPETAEGMAALAVEFELS